MNKIFISSAILVIALSGAACKKGPQAETPANAQQQQPATPDPKAPPKPMPAQLPDVLARVNGQPVTKFDFDRLIKNLEMQQGQIPAERRDEIMRAALDQLITYHVLKNEAAARGITVTDAEVDERVTAMRGQSSPADFQKQLDARNTTLDQLKIDARIDMVLSKMLEGEASQAIAATEAEAKDFYDKNPDKFEQPESIRASHILLMVNEKADDATRKKTREKIESILKRARAGEDFAKLAKENSQDGSAQQGGDLGFFRRGQMVPAFEQAAFALKPGEISDVVTTPYGFHIIKAAEKRAAQKIPYEQVKPRILEYLSGQKKQQRVEAFIEEAKKKAKIEVLV